MLSSITSFFSSFPHELATFLMAMLPIGELRLSLPVAILAYKMPIWEAFFWSVVGNMIPVTIILFLADKFHLWIQKKTGFFAKGWIKSLARAQNKFEKDWQRYGLIGLMIFVGIPLPGTGAYTGALAAFVFGIPIKKSWPYIFGGVIISGVLTLLLTVGADKIF